MNKPVLISVLVLAAIAASFLLPKPKYTSLNILKELNIPKKFAKWKSKDVTKELNLSDDRYNFISDIFARLYEDHRGNQLLLLILDAGNFHNPKVCFGNTGYSVKDLGQTNFTINNSSFKANTLHMEKAAHTMVMYYWLCLDKKTVNWAEQKILELWSTLFHKKKTGLMIRLEIPAKNKTREECFAFAGDFMQTLSNHLTSEQREYLFGQ